MKTSKMFRLETSLMPFYHQLTGGAREAGLPGLLPPFAPDFLSLQRE